jgi:DnaJ-class molecular chaperone
VGKFEEVDSARRLLGLGDEASLEEIKMAYKEICKRYHPDKHPEKSKSRCERMMKKINHAYNLIMQHIKECRYSFREPDVRKSDPDHVMERFWDDWMWGKVK